MRRLSSIRERTPQSSERLEVHNLTRGRLVAGQAEVARGPLRRGLGLMGRRGWRGLDGLVLRGCNAIHSFFMRMPIDVLYVDRQGKVLRTAEAMQPWRIGPIVRRCDWILELPAGTLARMEVCVGDRLAVTR